MTENEYSEMVRSLAKSGENIIKELTPLNAHLLHMAAALCGEAGEVVDAIKKGAIYNQPLNLENIKEELGDLEFYMEGIRQALGLKREEVLQHNQAKLFKRYNGKYSNSAAQIRADKEHE